jgi:SWI/SNF-related matrix-associated actin-dependent regulator 1 of chromatin subfamily A
LNSEKLSYDDYIAKHGKDDIDPPDFTEMSKVMKEVAIAKIPYAIEYLKEVLSEKEEQKVAVWTHHHEVSDALIAAFGSEAVCVDGRVSIENRQHSVDSFQTDPRIKIFIGSIQAAGVGITLTAASLALFVERSWTPALVTQAEDRLHRIGQKENVLIRHLVFNGSQDQRQVQALVRKQEIADRVLDKEKV